MKLNLLLLLFIFFSKFSFATEKPVDPNLIHKNLRCLVCQGQSISDSNSDFAQTIKLVVKDLIDEGKTEEVIYSFMSDKYGEWIVYKPRFNIFNSISNNYSTMGDLARENIHRNNFKCNLPHNRNWICRRTYF